MNTAELFEKILNMMKPEAKNMFIEKIDQAMENLILLGEPIPEAHDMINEVKSHFPDGNIWKDEDELMNTTPETGRKHVTLLVDKESPEENMMMYVDGHVISLN